MYQRLLLHFLPPYLKLFQIKLITPATTCEKIKCNASLARAGLKELERLGLIRTVRHTITFWEYLTCPFRLVARGGGSGSAKEVAATGELAAAVDWDLKWIAARVSIARAQLFQTNNAETASPTRCCGSRPCCCW
jgi:hypothetical protein